MSKSLRGDGGMSEQKVKMGNVLLFILLIAFLAIIFPALIVVGIFLIFLFVIGRWWREKGGE